MTLKVRILWPSIGRVRPKPLFLSVVPAPEPVPLLAQVWGPVSVPAALVLPEPAPIAASTAPVEPEALTFEEPILAVAPPILQESTHLPVLLPVPALVSAPNPVPASVAVPTPTPSFSTFIDQEREKGTEEWNESTVRQVPPPVKRSPRVMGPGILTKTFSWLRKNYSPTAKKALRISETVNLGEKRFVAIIHADGHKFLIGGGSSGVSLLTQLGKQSEVGDPHLSIHELTERSA